MMLSQSIRKIVSLLVVTTLAALGLMLAVTPAHAVESTVAVSINHTHDSTASCDDSATHVDILGMTDEVDQPGGEDRVRLVAADANGVVVFDQVYDYAGPHPKDIGATLHVVTGGMTARPLTIALFDVNADASEDFLNEVVTDPATYGAMAMAFCGGQPVETPYSFAPGALSGYQDDTRINPEGDGITSAAIYCTPEGGVQVYGIDPDTGKGWLAINVGADELAALPDAPFEHVLVAEAGGISLWKLTTGELQLMAPTVDGKTYLFIWDGCPGGVGGHGETH